MKMTTPPPVGPKTELQGQPLLNQCNLNWYGQTYTPSNAVSGECPPADNSPLDRAGNPIFGCYNMAGNHDTGARSTPLHGHPQDFSRKLYTTDMFQKPFGWEERGIELYENFGLSEDLFAGSGNYSFIGPDVKPYTNGSGQGSYCSNGTQTGPSSRQCQNRCITELGRKLSLIGQVGFTYFDYADSNRFCDGQVPPNPGNFVYGYTFTFYKETRNDCGDLYDYFGNSAVIIKDANGVQWYFIYGQTPFKLDQYFVRTEATADQLNWFSYNTSTKIMQVELRYFDPTMVSPLGLNCIKNNVTLQASISATGNCTSSPNSDYLNLPAAPIPFPGNYYSQLFCDTGYTEILALGTTPFANCNYSGFRSMYIPPHMRVDEFSTSLYSNNTSSWNSGNGTQLYVCQTYGQSGTGNKLAMTPFTYDLSPFRNGTFPSLSGSIANSPLDANVQGNVYRGTSYLTPNVHNCALLSIWANVRRDTAFRNRYVNRWYTNQKLLPETMLVPGVQNATLFMEQLSTPQPSVNPMQAILNPQDFWSTANSANWDGKSMVTLNLQKQPYDVIPTDAPVAQVVSTSTALIMKNLPTLAKPYNALMNKIVKLNRSIRTTVTYTAKPQGRGRITSFDPSNGIFSLEWLYVIYTCAFSYAPNQTNGLSYDTSTKQYTCTGSNSTCLLECALFRDPYYYDNPQGASASDLFMKTYCGMKNLTLAYGSYSNPSSNDCSCTTTASYCPGAFSPSCDPTKMGSQQIYVPDGTIDTTAACSDTCSYCKSVNVQLNIQNGNISGKQNNGIKNVGSCGNQSGCFSGANESFIADYPIMFIIIFLILIIVISVIGYFGYKKYTTHRSGRDSPRE